MQFDAAWYKIHTSKQMRKLNRKYYGFLQSFLCSFKASNIVPFNVWFLHHNGTYRNTMRAHVSHESTAIANRMHISSSVQLLHKNHVCKGI